MYRYRVRNWLSLFLLRTRSCTAILKSHCDFIKQDRDHDSQVVTSENYGVTSSLSSPKSVCTPKAGNTRIQGPLKTTPPPFQEGHLQSAWTNWPALRFYHTPDNFIKQDRDHDFNAATGVNYGVASSSSWCKSVCNSKLDITKIKELLLKVNTFNGCGQANQNISPPRTSPSVLT